MALKRPAPKALSTDAVAKILTESTQQTGKVQRIRTYDKDYPF